jgi:hypothetical protein
MDTSPPFQKLGFLCHFTKCLAQLLTSQALIGGYPFVIQVVVKPISLPLSPHESQVFQDAQMLGDGRRTDTQFLG